MKIEWPIYSVDAQGNDVETMYDVEVNILSMGSPGKTYGLPENCYPPEPPEAEIDSIKLQGLGKQPGIEMAPAVWETIGFTDKVIEEIYEAAFEQASQKAKDDEDARGDAEYDRRKEDRLFGDREIY